MIRKKKMGKQLKEQKHENNKKKTFGKTVKMGLN